MFGTKFCFLLLLLFCSLSGFSQEEGSKTIYVWDFSDRSGKEDDLTASLTEEFEEALIKSDCCKVLQRRTYARLFDQRENEKAIISLTNLSSATVETLEAIEANTVAFGQVHDDTRSGQFKISISFENFTGEMEKSASVYMAKYDINNPKKREIAISELIDELELAASKSPVETKKVDDWEFSLTGCEKIGKNVKCSFSVTSHHRDRSFKIGGGSSAIDNKNYEYTATQRKLTNKTASSSYTIQVNLVDGIRADGYIIFENVASIATYFPRLRFVVRGDDLSEKYIEFRNVKF
jgi:hypothetical protein